MNFTDNWVKEVIKVERITLPEVQCFRVQVKDSYGKEMFIDTMYTKDIKRMQEGTYSWRE